MPTTSASGATGRRVTRSHRHHNFPRAGSHATHGSSTRPRSAAVAADAEGRIGYLAGGSENEADVWNLFDRVVYLVADDETISERLTVRTNNNFGRSDEELAMVLGWNALLEPHYRDAGAVVVDAGQPLPVVVRAVRAAASSNGRGSHAPFGP